jgi:hypothetical protein
MGLECSGSSIADCLRRHIDPLIQSLEAFNPPVLLFLLSQKASFATVLMTIIGSAVKLARLKFRHMGMTPKVNTNAQPWWPYSARYKVKPADVQDVRLINVCSSRDQANR